MDAIAAYTGLFASAFLAATLVPAQSEAVLLGLLALERYPVSLLFFVATVGNVLGSCLNYSLGRFFSNAKRLSDLISPAHRDSAERYYRRYGRWSLLLSWLPVVGDPITIIAGALRERFLYFFVLVTIAKAGRYYALLGTYQALFS